MYLPVHTVGHGLPTVWLLLTAPADAPMIAERICIAATCHLMRNQTC